MSFGIAGHDEMAIVSKAEPGREGSSSSLGSSPDPEVETFAPETTGTQKRKGGRKPIYATSEERKQRNRQAQAAFRERRTEYIKHLEATIKNHEETLASLQQSHRSAADECLMLRYKNSLLERILIEKGIDVQAELRAKTGSPHLGPMNVPAVSASAAEPPPIQRAIMNRHHHARRSNSGLASKADPSGQVHQASRGNVFASQSPRLQPTPPSQTSSPNPTSPVYVLQGVMTPPASELLAQQQQQHQRQQSVPNTHSQPAYNITMTSSSSSRPTSVALASGPGSSGASSTSTFYTAPFQNHIDQLEQEYDEQADMVDEPETSDHSAGPGPYAQSFLQHSVPPQLGRHAQPPPSTQQGEATGAVFGAVNQLFDPYDPMLDADPFGLSASMHFSTPFSFETSSMR